ncbi:hypothetical protein [Lonepinella sp. BR2357]|uniref:hypothetical protein n=1 Tax=Lonepinella sp. BR2357 TaxID=3434549 RepID=UPI003F6DDED0
MKKLILLLLLLTGCVPLQAENSTLSSKKMPNYVAYETFAKENSADFRHYFEQQYAPVQSKTKGNFAWTALSYDDLQGNKMAAPVLIVGFNKAYNFVTQKQFYNLLQLNKNEAKVDISGNYCYSGESKATPYRFTLKTGDILHVMTYVYYDVEEPSTKETWFIFSKQQLNCDFFNIQGVKNHTKKELQRFEKN